MNFLNQALLTAGAELWRHHHHVESNRFKLVFRLMDFKIDVSKNIQTRQSIQSPTRRLSNWFWNCCDIVASLEWILTINGTFFSALCLLSVIDCRILTWNRHSIQHLMEQFSTFEGFCCCTGMWSFDILNVGKSGRYLQSKLYNIDLLWLWTKKEIK